MNQQPEPQVPNPDQPGSGPQHGGSRRHRRVLAGAALAAGLAIGGAGVAAAVTSSSHSSSVAGGTSATVAAQGANGHHHRRAGHKGRHKGDAMQRALHGEFTVRAPGSKAGAAMTTRVLLVQRGSVTAVSSTSITLKSADGFTATYPVSSSTKVRAAGKLATISAIKTGAKVHVLAVKGGAALLVGEGGPHPRMARPGTTRPGTASGASFSMEGAVAEL